MSNLTDPRVFFAAERTLLAWNRTSLGLIAFGFIIERSKLMMLVAFFPAVHGTQTQNMGLLSVIGLSFICLGAVVAVLSSIQYRQELKTLQPSEIPAHYWLQMGMWLNDVVVLLSLLLAYFVITY